MKPISLKRFSTNLKNKNLEYLNSKKNSLHYTIELQKEIILSFPNLTGITKLVAEQEGSTLEKLKDDLLIYNKMYWLIVLALIKKENKTK